MNITMIFVIFACGFCTVAVITWAEGRVNYWRNKARSTEDQLQWAKVALNLTTEERDELRTQNAAMKKHLTKLKQLRRQPAAPTDSGQAEKETT